MYAAVSLPRTIFLAAALSATFVASSARALECGSSIVTVGDSGVRVREVCGEPVSTISRMEARTVFQGNGTAAVAVTITVQVDTWVFDFGPGRFRQELTFENGVLVRSRSLGRSGR